MFEVSFAQPSVDSPKRQKPRVFKLGTQLDHINSVLAYARFWCSTWLRGTKHTDRRGRLVYYAPEQYGLFTVELGKCAGERRSFSGAASPSLFSKRDCKWPLMRDA